MKKTGIADTSPSHPKLLALLKAGACEAEFVAAAAEAVQRGKGFAYALGVVANRRQEAASVAAGGAGQVGRAIARKAASTEPAWRTEQRNRMQQACPRIAAKPLADVLHNPTTTIDVEARHVPPIALG